MNTMTRAEAQKMFDGSAEKLRRFLGLKTVQGVYIMPPDKPMPAKHILRMQQLNGKKR